MSYLTAALELGPAESSPRGERFGLVSIPVERQPAARPLAIGAMTRKSNLMQRRDTNIVETVDPSGIRWATLVDVDLVRRHGRDLAHQGAPRTESHAVDDGG